MSMKKKTYFILAALLCLSLMVSVGCTSTEKTPEKKPPVQENTTTPPTTTPETTGTNGAESKKIADAIVKDLADVEDATVVVSGDMAYAAIKIRDTADAAKAEDIKKEVIAKIQETDKNIKNAYVSEDAAVFTRIKEIGADIASGKPISGFIEEIQNLFTRVTPSK